MSAATNPVTPHFMSVAGRVDALNATRLDDQLRTLSEAGAITIILELSQVTYISSRGLRVLLLAHRRQQRRGGQLLLRNLAPRILGLLQLCGFDRVLNIERNPGPSSTGLPDTQG